jgi:hypothetical protein
MPSEGLVSGPEEGSYRDSMALVGEGLLAQVTLFTEHGGPNARHFTHTGSFKQHLSFARIYSTEIIIEEERGTEVNNLPR